MIKQIITLLLTLCCGAATATGVFNVRDYGAKGDGQTLDHVAVNRAIEDCVAHGGGQVLVPAGTYLCGSIRLKSHVELHLTAGATILAAPSSQKAYDEPEAWEGPQYQDGGHTFFHNSLIWAEGAQNVSITGRGTIDGQGLTKKDNEKAGVVQGGSIGTGDKAIALKLCRNILIRDITIFRGGHFAIIVTGCDRGTIDNVTIDTNRDGIDIDCCKYLTVSNTKVNTPSDDAIVLKSSYALKRAVTCEHILITNCLVTGYKLGTFLDGTYQPEPVNWVCGRIKLGTESNGGYRNITISNCTCMWSSGLAFEEVDQGCMENITVTNIAMDHVHHYPIYITTGCRNRGPKEVTQRSSARNIQISNIVANDCDSLCSIIVTGMKDEPIRNVWLSNIRLSFKGGGTKELFNRNYREQGTNYPEPRWAGPTPAYGLYARHVDGLHVNDITFRYQRPEYRPAIVLDDVCNVTLDHIDAPTESGIEQIVHMQAVDRQKLNFNSGWCLEIGDFKEASQPDYDDSRWQPVTLPYAFNGHEAFKKDIVDLTDTVVWYRKHFTLTDVSQRKVFLEFEGVRQGADFYLNGHHLGMSENGVMACGFDLTPYIKEGKNTIAVRCDNSWTYRSRKHDSRYQWNDKNFNANYGGIPKNVFLHLTDKLYQTLPLYSDLGTTGTYIYATDFDIPNHKAVIHAESQVKNEDIKARSFTFFAKVLDADGKEVAHFNSERITMQPGETRDVKIQQEVSGLHFWSWGYGYLYTVKTGLVVDGLAVDMVATRTGFRKTRFGEGKIWLNDRVLMVHGYAQRTSNEWPGVGLSVPAWLSDYSNGLMVESGGNLVRWMHVTPWKQDIESCDRVGLIQAMPAGDAEKDVEGPRWTQRTELMRDAIIYNRNNPSILFYEGGNESISREHMLELKHIRDQYDPYGGRAIGSREMLDIDEAEYGGEMLYINKSKKHPMWAMEYCRDEGLRKYWDEWSYPFHKEGDGPLYRGKSANDYNHNMDQLAVEMVRRWYDYWRERPGTGTRVSSGGVKIVFSDTNTHHRGESNYRTSGVTDAMRIPKDAFFVHQVMWNGWVEPEAQQTYIIGHWTYRKGTKKPVYVVSTGDEVELFLNGKSLGHGKQSYRYLFTFDDVPFEPGTLEAVASDGSRYKLETAGEPHSLKLTTIENPEGMKADGADMALIQVEVVDKQGRRCPLDDRLVNFTLMGEGRWIGGIASGKADNYVGAMALPVECGVNRVLVRSTVNAGTITVYASAEGLKGVQQAVIKTHAADAGSLLPTLTLKSHLSREETPLSPSYTDRATGIAIREARAGYDSEHALRSYDDNELSEWKNDGRLSTAWITYKLERKAAISDICLKLTGWRLRSYPLEIYAGKQLIWSGETPRSLGYVHLTPTQRVKTGEITIRLKGAGKDKDAFGGIVEVAEPAAGELDLFKAKNGGDTKNELRIVEVEFIEQR